MPVWSDVSFKHSKWKQEHHCKQFYRLLLQISFFLIFFALTLTIFFECICKTNGCFLGIWAIMACYCGCNAGIEGMLLTNSYQNATLNWF